MTAEIESVKRARLEPHASVGALRRALADERIPDEASIIYAEMSHYHASDDDYTVADFEAGMPPTETVFTVEFVIEWEADA